MATGCPHPYGGRVPRGPFWKDRDTGAVHGPEYVSLSATATASAADPGDSARATNKTAILAAVASAAAQNKALLVDGLFWWDAGASAGLDLSADGVKIIGRNAQCFPAFSGTDGFVGKVSSAPVSPKNGLSIDSTSGQELWHIYVRGDGASVRGTLPGHHGFFGRNVEQFSMVGCQFASATAASVLFSGFSNVYVGRCLTTGGLADAFHFTAGEGPGTNAYLENCYGQAPGDDYYAVVAYNGQGSNGITNVTVRNSGGQATTSGSRINVVGGENILYQDIFIRDCGTKGINCASETAYGAGLIDNVTFRRVRIGECGVGLSGTANNAFIVNSTTSYTVSNVEFIDCAVVKINTSSIAYLLDTGNVSNVLFDGCYAGSTAAVGAHITGAVSNVTFRDSVITSSGNHAVLIDDAGIDEVTFDGCTITLNANDLHVIYGHADVSNVTVTGCALAGSTASNGRGIFIDAGGENWTITNNTITRNAAYGISVSTVAVTGTLTITGNTISDISKIGTNPESFIDAISVSVNSPSATLIVNGNTHNNPNSNEYQFDWELRGQTTVGAHQCMNNVRGTNTGGALANYASDATNDQGNGVAAIAAAGWTISGNT